MPKQSDYTTKSIDLMTSKEKTVVVDTDISGSKDPYSSCSIEVERRLPGGFAIELAQYYSGFVRCTNEATSGAVIKVRILTVSAAGTSDIKTAFNTSATYPSPPASPFPLFASCTSYYTPPRSSVPSYGSLTAVTLFFLSPTPRAASFHHQHLGSTSIALL